MGTIAIRLKPGAKQDRIDAGEGAEIGIAVTSPPVEGKANTHLIKLLSKTLGVPKSSCSIIKGAGSRSKVVDVDGMETAEIRRKLAERS
jgi:uncharacterized protein (TIGR00251 family)